MIIIILECSVTRSVGKSGVFSSTLKMGYNWGPWVGQSVKRLTSAQIMISQLVSLSPGSGSLLKAQSLEPASDSVSLSLCPSPTRILFLSQK